MVSTNPAALPGEPPASDSFTITLRGREYPITDRVAPQPASDPAEQQRNALIVERLWSELPFTELDPGCADRTQIVKAYTASIGRLHECQREVERLFALMCEINLQFRSQGRLHEQMRDEAMRAKQREMLDRGRFAPFLDDGTLTAELTAEPPEVIRMRLNKSLRAITESFVRELFAALDRFVGGETVGLIDWFGEGVCKFHFFSESVTQTNTWRRRVRGRERRGRRVGTRHVEVLQDVTDETGGVHLHRHARHEHHLMNAKAHAVGAQELAVPEAAAQLIEVIPEWLRPLVRIVEGDRIRERIIEREVRKEKWRKKHRETVRRLESVHYHIDPAVTLDCYVLTGWGECAIREEEERQDIIRQRQELAGRRAARSRSTENAGLRFWVAAGGAALVQALAVSLVILSLVAPPLVIAAAFVTLASLLPVAFALQLFAASRVRQADWKYLTTGTAAALTASVGAQMLILGALQPWLLLVILGGVFAVAGYAFGRRTAACYTLLPELPY